MENPKGQTSEEVPRGQITRHRPDVYPDNVLTDKVVEEAEQEVKANANTDVRTSRFARGRRWRL
ncbi:hypothetical protein EYF80_002787 [Liparis tanakae]|uniref:Uncharacterized protein n=1 Tax=Liparis tanakae TaxID=230148 RepID=A0A4Z2JCK2_9TELE|nr:hypothetical protein EYF80_002787 [Liparis tanakae]